MRRPPRRRDKSGWTAVEAMLNAGLRYGGFEPCGCGREPKSRPRTSAQVRTRRGLGAGRHRRGAGPAGALRAGGAVAAAGTMAS